MTSERSLFPIAFCLAFGSVGCDRLLGIEVYRYTLLGDAGPPPSDVPPTTDGGAVTAGTGSGMGSSGAPSSANASGGIFKSYVFVRGAPSYYVAPSDAVLSGSLTREGTYLTERGGGVAFAADGSFVYSPPSPAFWGDDHFSYPPETPSGRRRITVQPGSIDLDDYEQEIGNGFRIIGEDDSSHAPARAGDVNGDGLADLMLGRTSVAGNSSPGFAYVVFGKADDAVVPLSGLAATTGMTASGVGAEDQLGLSVAGGSDVNGDGFDDVIAGAPYVNQTQSMFTGGSYVLFGGAVGGPRSLAALGTEAAAPSGFAITSDYLLNASSSQLGLAVAMGGDFNGDGRADLVVSAPYGTVEGAVDRGFVYVVFGKPDGAAVSVAEIARGAPSGFVVRGSRALDLTGSAVANAGDVNGDGLDDVIIGAKSQRDVIESGAVVAQWRGLAYVIFGKRDSAPVELAAIEAGMGGGFLIENDSADFLGFSVSGAGDVNGDGLSDLLVGSNSGAYVIFGAPSADPVSTSQIERGERGFSIAANGGQVSLAGDVDGDGLDDLLIAAGSQACLIFGKGDGAPVDLADVIAQPGPVGVPLSSASGVRVTSVSGVGDVNGDGLADIALGGLIYPGQSTYARGDAYVLFGWDARNKLLERDRAFVGGRGDDIFEYAGAPFVSISGGNGTDTLRFVGHDLTLDLRAPARLHSIEVIDLTGDGDNTLLLDDAAIRSLPQSRPGLAAGLAKTLVVVGDAGDRVLVDLSGYSSTPVQYAGRDVYAKKGAYYGLELSSGLYP